MAKTRVVVVDDSALVRSLLAEIINRQPDMECVGAAADPLVAREMIRNLNPDVITLDVEMPRMDGIDFLGKLMRLRPMPVVMVSTLTERGADVTLRALELGAVDFVAKPKIGVADGLRQLAEDITDKIRIAAKAHTCAGCQAPPLGGRPPAAPRSAATERLAAGAPVDREDHLHRRLHRRHRGHPRSADQPAGRLPGGGDHPAHAAGLHQELCRAAGRPVPHPRGRSARRRAHPARPRLHRAGRHAPERRAQRRQLHRAGAGRRAGEPPQAHRSRCCSSRRRGSWGPTHWASCSPAWAPTARGRCARCATPAATTWCRTRRAAWSSACRARPSPHGAAHEVLPLTQIAPRLIERLRSTNGALLNRI